jgi:hypothetical protein
VTKLELVTTNHLEHMQHWNLVPVVPQPDAKEVVVWLRPAYEEKWMPRQGLWNGDSEIWSMYRVGQWVWSHELEIIKVWHWRVEVDK